MMGEVRKTMEEEDITALRFRLASLENAVRELLHHEHELTGFEFSGSGCDISEEEIGTYEPYYPIMREATKYYHYDVLQSRDLEGAVQCSCKVCRHSARRSVTECIEEQCPCCTTEDQDYAKCELE
jgi:hypothetical protein